MSGPNEITCRPARPLPEAPEEAIGQAAGTTSQVGTRERVPGESPDVLGTGLDAGGAAAHTAEIFGAIEGSAGATALAAVGLPLLAGAAGVAMIVHADEEIERRGEVYASAKKLGALLVLEGRGRGPEVQRLRNELAARDDHDSLTQLRGLQDGIEAAYNWLDAHPCEGRQLCASVRVAMNEGQLAVARGNDHGAAFERRMGSDPAFRDGVEYMHRLRDERPAEFETRAADVRAMMSHVDASRRSAARM